MADNKENNRSKITFSSINGNKKIDFSSIKLRSSGLLKTNSSFNSQNLSSNSFLKKDNINDKTTNEPVSQFRKPNFSYLQQQNTIKQQQENNNDLSNSNNNIKNPQPKQQQITQHFRKPNFSYLQQQNNISKGNNSNNNFNNKTTNSDFKKSNGNGTFFIKKDNQQKFNNNSNFNYNKDKYNNQITSNGGNHNKFFVKKNNQVKVKINTEKKNNNDKSSYKKTANTGGNVDKYSINSMLQGLNNNLELDTEIDDVLGNVINVKLATINSSNSFQHERKVRTSTSGNKKVNFSTPIVREINIYNDQISISRLADKMSISVKELVNVLIKNGININTNEKDIGDIIIDGDTAQIIAETYGHKIKRIADNDAEKEFIDSIFNNRKEIKKRAPIVTIMGHVDHGKTTLLDYIRKASVASSEAGGITQHIGAYRTKVGDKYITFLDTPGHAAFTQMRMRGAKTTDIAVIVIAADDGIMPQTIEAINHAKVAGCPIIVAINKIDKPEANIERAKQMLLQHEVIPEELGGDVIVVPISAKEGKNIDKLLEAILLQAEILDLNAYYDGGVDGVVIESKLDKKRGALSTIIVKNGTLHQGDFLIAGEQYGKIRGMFDENGNILKTAEPSVPVEILGLNATPDAGEICYAVKNEKDAKEILNYRIEKAKQKMQQSKSSLSTEDIFAKINGTANNVKNVSFIIKADTKGSLEAIVSSLQKIDEDNNSEVKLKIVHTGIGTINENDVLLASSCNGYIFTFNTQKCDKKVMEEAEKKGVEIKDYKIIYELFDDVKDVLSGKLKPVIKKNVLGHCEVKAIFEISKVGKIAGCLVKDGVISRGANIAIIRNGESILETKCDSLKHGKESVKDIQNGQECGVGIEKINEVQIGDILEFFTTKEEKKYKNI